MTDLNFVKKKKKLKNNFFVPLKVGSNLNKLFLRFAGDLKVMSFYALFWNI